MRDLAIVAVLLWYAVTIHRQNVADQAAGDLSFDQDPAMDLVDQLGGYADDTYTTVSTTVNSLLAKFAMPQEISDLIDKYAEMYGVDPNLAKAQAMAESGRSGWQNAQSPVGAIGVFQLMPATAAGLGVDPYDLEQNIKGGVKFLSQLLNQYGGDVAKALAAYNWGPGHVNRQISNLGSAWDTNLPDETENYVNKIQSWVDQLNG